MILPNRKTYLLYPTRTSTRTDLVSLLASAVTHQSIMGSKRKVVFVVLGKELAAVGVVGTVNRRFKVLWKNRSLVFPQNRQFPQRFSPAHLVYAAGKYSQK